MNEVNEALADVKIEGQDAFEGLGETTPSESLPEKKQEEEKPIQGDNTDDLNTPFHKHPRWIERENELKSLKERDEAREREILELKEKYSQIQTPRNTNVPEWFATLYGNNPEAWEKYSEHTKQEREQIKQEVMEAQKQEIQHEEEVKKYWDNWVENEMNKLKAKGYKFDEKELTDVMLKTKPTDAQGNLDFEAGYETYVARKGPAVNPQISQARKQVADSISKTSRGEPAKKNYMTSADLRNKSWHQL